jgi:hypothetical protein
MVVVGDGGEAVDVVTRQWVTKRQGLGMSDVSVTLVAGTATNRARI